MTDADPSPIPEASPLPRDLHLFGPGPKRILALDGGGLRGIVALAFLERLEAELVARHGPGARLCDHVDLIGGASTGAILASGLALGMPVAELIEAYLRFAREAFRGSTWHGGVLVPMYRTRPLLAAIRQYVGDTTLGSPRLRTGLAIVAKRIDTGSVWVFHNNPRGRFYAAGAGAGAAGAVANGELPLAQLIRASTAAPTFFAPEWIEVAPSVAGLFVDGAVSPHMNPALLMLLVATLRGYGFAWPMGEERLSLVSVGTGTRPMSTARLPGRAAPAAALAVTALRSVMEDCSWLGQALLQWLGATEQPWRIDAEIGDLAGEAPGGRKLLRYVRHEMVLEAGWLAREAGVVVTEAEIEALDRVDDPAMVPRLLEVARAVAARSGRFLGEDAAWAMDTAPLR